MGETESHTAVPLKRSRLSWPAVRLLVLAAVAVVVAIFGVEYLGRASGEQRCRRQLVFISRGLMLCRSYYGHLPPAYLMDSNGRRMHSWRAVLMPFVDINDLNP
jgi:hypothetical protein